MVLFLESGINGSFVPNQFYCCNVTNLFMYLCMHACIYSCVCSFIHSLIHVKCWHSGRQCIIWTFRTKAVNSAHGGIIFFFLIIYKQYINNNNNNNECYWYNEFCTVRLCIKKVFVYLFIWFHVDFCTEWLWLFSEGVVYSVCGWLSRGKCQAISGVCDGCGGGQADTRKTLIASVLPTPGHMRQPCQHPDSTVDLLFL